MNNLVVAEGVSVGRYELLNGRVSLAGQPDFRIKARCQNARCSLVLSERVESSELSCAIGLYDLLECTVDAFPDYVLRNCEDVLKFVGFGIDRACLRDGFNAFPPA